MSKTMEAIKMIADAFESHDGRAVEQAIFTISDARLLMDALSEGPRFKGQASLRPEGVAIGLLREVANEVGAHELGTDLNLRIAEFLSSQLPQDGSK